MPQANVKMTVRRITPAVSIIDIQGDVSAYKTYMRCLFDTFGRGYVEHLEAWLRADGVISPAEASSIGETSP